MRHLIRFWGFKVTDLTLKFASTSLKELKLAEIDFFIHRLAVSKYSYYLGSNF